MMMHKKMAGVAGVMAAVAMVGCGGNQSAVASGPDDAILQVRDSIVENKPEAAFEMLPPSYQADINSVVADAAKRMDEEIWNQGVGILQQVTRILESKRDLILSTEAMSSVPNPEDLKKNWKQGVSVLQAIVRSDFTNLERLQQGDVGKLLSESGAKIMASATDLMASSEQAAEAEAELDKIRNMTATVVSQEGDTAVVKVDTEGEEPEELEMVRVEGRWIPKDMADGFKEGIAEMRENLAGLDFSSEEGQQQKTMILAQMGGIKSMLDQLENAKTKEELEGIFGGLMMGIMGAMGGGM